LFPGVPTCLLIRPALSTLRTIFPAPSAVTEQAMRRSRLGKLWLGVDSAAAMPGVMQTMPAGCAEGQLACGAPSTELLAKLKQSEETMDGLAGVPAR
jgi:hypothetical protein